MKSSIMLVVTCFFVIFPQSLIAKSAKSDGWNTSSAAFSHTSCCCCKGDMKGCKCCSAKKATENKGYKSQKDGGKKVEGTCTCNVQKEGHSEQNALPIPSHNNGELQEVQCRSVLISDVFANTNYQFFHKNSTGFFPPHSSFPVPLRI